MHYDVLASALSENLAHGDFDALRSFARAEHPADLASYLQELRAEEAWQVLTLLEVGEQAEIFGYFQPRFQVALAEQVGRRRLARLVSAMDADDRADLFNALSEDEREALLPALAQAEREDIRKLAGYQEGTAGAIMTSDYATLGAELTARQALDQLRREAPAKETIYQAYVIDRDRRLIGAVDLQDLILAAPGTPVRDLMDAEPFFARVEDPQQEVAQKIARYDLIALPVVNGGEALVGIVTHDDALDVLEEEATEDFHKVGTVGKLDSSVSGASFGLLYRKRVGWLVLLVFGNLLSGAGIAYYEETISTYVTLVFFLPLLIASSGNAGAQAGTMMVRALATGDVVMRDWGRMIGRELVVATALGLTMALAISGIGLWRGGPEIALVVAITMVIVVLAGSLVGTSLPFILSRLRLDPATASAPLITSIADAAGVVTYFALASAVLNLPA